MAERETFAQRFKSADQARQQILDRKRLCAALTKPWHLPPRGMQSGDKLPESYQSLGARGEINMAGRFLIAGYPLSQPWVRLQPAPEIRFDPNVSPQRLAEIENELYFPAMLAQAKLESAHPKSKSVSGRRRASFYTKKRVVLEMIIGIGDVLQRLDDDYNLHYYRMDRYVTKRNSSGDVLYHTLVEQVDPLSLTDEEIAAAHLDKAELIGKHVSDRMVDIYTNVQWQPQSRKWQIEQEINGHLIGEPIEQDVPSFWSTTYELIDGDDYGRSFIESNLGDLGSYNELREKMLDFAALHSKQIPVIDYYSQMREKDLTKKSGEAIRGRVQGGKLMDATFWSPNTATNYEVVRATASEVRADLSKALLIESEVQPNKDRVTATQVRQIAQELQGATGGLWAPLADEDMTPMIERTLWQLKRDKLIAPIDGDDVRAEPLTGLAALARGVEADKVLGALRQLAPLGDGLVSRLDIDAIINIVLRTEGIAHLGLTKSREQLAQEVQDRMLQAAAAKGIDVAGNVAEARATQTTAA